MRAHAAEGPHAKCSKNDALEIVGSSAGWIGIQSAGSHRAKTVMYTSKPRVIGEHVKRSRRESMVERRRSSFLL
eukprot:1194772-Prorocentrum_minimum.AAC.1